jgi:hypothetical protein
MNEFLERLKAEHPEVDWDAEMMKARKRRERRRTPCGTLLSVQTE